VVVNNENHPLFLAYLCPMFSYIGIGINLLLILLLASKKGKALADRILLVWLVLICCHLSLFALTLQPITTNNVHWLLGTGIPFPLLHGPMLYLYTAAMTNMLPSKRKFLLIHFLPAIIAVLFFLPVFLKSADEKLAFIASNGKGYQTANLVRIILLQVSGFVYVLWSLWLLRKHKHNISREFSYEERINLNWLRYFIYSLAAIWIIIVLTRSDYYIFVGTVVFIIFLGYFGIRQVGIFTPASLYKANKEVETEQQASIYSIETSNKFDFVEQQPERIIAEPPEPSVSSDETEIPIEVEETKPTQRKKYASSGVTEEMSNDIHQRLTQFMTTEKLFTEPELSLSMLAEKINVHSNYLSQVINEKEGKTFFEYVNSLRVEEFKRLAALPENKQFTIMSLAYDCGFNSKSSFNKNFKKVADQSPSEYLASTDHQNGMGTSL
jgi:AraC-like DNA-binding protein